MQEPPNKDVTMAEPSNEDAAIAEPSHEDAAIAEPSHEDATIAEPSNVDETMAELTITDETTAVPTNPEEITAEPTNPEEPTAEPANKEETTTDEPPKKEESTTDEPPKKEQTTPGKPPKKEKTTPGKPPKKEETTPGKPPKKEKSTTDEPSKKDKPTAKIPIGVKTYLRRPKEGRAYERHDEIPPFPYTPPAFCFTVPSATVLRNAIDALIGFDVIGSTAKIKTEAMLQVGEHGAELTVLKQDRATSNLTFGFLRLKATGLLNFQCNKPFIRRVILDGISKMLMDAIKAEGDSSVSIRAEIGSNRLFLKFGSSESKFALGLPVTFALGDVGDDFWKFPDVTYGFVTVVPSIALRTMIKQVLQKPPRVRAQVNATLHPTVVGMAVGDVVLDPIEPEEYQVALQWKYWTSLEKASELSDNCLVYLVNDPEDQIMLKFNLGEVGDMVYLTQAEFISVPELPERGHFLSLT